MTDYGKLIKIVNIVKDAKKKVYDVDYVKGFTYGNPKIPAIFKITSIEHNEASPHNSIARGKYSYYGNGRRIDQPSWAFTLGFLKEEFSVRFGNDADAELWLKRKGIANYDLIERIKRQYNTDKYGTYLYIVEFNDPNGRKTAKYYLAKDDIVAHQKAESILRKNNVKWANVTQNKQLAWLHRGPDKFENLMRSVKKDFVII